MTMQAVSQTRPMSKTREIFCVLGGSTISGLTSLGVIQVTTTTLKLVGAAPNLRQAAFVAVAAGAAYLFTRPIAEAGFSAYLDHRDERRNVRRAALANTGPR